MNVQQVLEKMRSAKDLKRKAEKMSIGGLSSEDSCEDGMMAPPLQFANGRANCMSREYEGSCGGLTSDGSSEDGTKAPPRSLPMGGPSA